MIHSAHVCWLLELPDICSGTEKIKKFVSVTEEEEERGVNTDQSHGLNPLIPTVWCRLSLVITLGTLLSGVIKPSLIAELQTCFIKDVVIDIIALLTESLSL